MKKWDKKKVKLASFFSIILYFLLLICFYPFLLAIDYPGRSMKPELDRFFCWFFFAGVFSLVYLSFKFYLIFKQGDKFRWWDWFSVVIFSLVSLIVLPGLIQELLYKIKRKRSQEVGGQQLFPISILVIALLLILPLLFIFLWYRKRKKKSQKSEQKGKNNW